MSELSVLEYPDKRLKQASVTVTEFDSSVGRLVGDLFDTLYATPGIGLSAPQVNDHQRVIVMDLSNSRSEPMVFINPEILKTSAPGIVEESCFSVPGITANILRPTRILVRALDQNGKTAEHNLKGMHAVCLQHELDHLNGILLVDRLSFLQRLRHRAALKKLQEVESECVNAA